MPLKGSAICCAGRSLLSGIVQLRGERDEEERHSRVEQSGHCSSGISYRLESIF